MLGSHGVPVSYMPNCTEQGRVAARAGEGDVAKAHTTRTTTSISALARRPEALGDLIRRTNKIKPPRFGPATGWSRHAVPGAGTDGAAGGRRGPWSRSGPGASGPASTTTPG